MMMHVRVRHTKTTTPQGMWAMHIHTWCDSFSTPIGGKLRRGMHLPML